LEIERKAGEVLEVSETEKKTVSGIFGDVFAIDGEFERFEVL